MCVVCCRADGESRVISFILLLSVNYFSQSVNCCFAFRILGSPHRQLLHYDFGYVVNTNCVFGNTCCCCCYYWWKLQKTRDTNAHLCIGSKFVEKSRCGENLFCCRP